MTDKIRTGPMAPDPADLAAIGKLAEQSAPQSNIRPITIDRDNDPSARYASGGIANQPSFAACPHCGTILMLKAIDGALKA
jgi:hypothetical protein